MKKFYIYISNIANYYNYEILKILLPYYLKDEDDNNLLKEFMDGTNMKEGIIRFKFGDINFYKREFKNDRVVFKHSDNDEEISIYIYQNVYDGDLIIKLGSFNNVVGSFDCCGYSQYLDVSFKDKQKILKLILPVFENYLTNSITWNMSKVQYSIEFSLNTWKNKYKDIHTNETIGHDIEYYLKIRDELKKNNKNHYEWFLKDIIKHNTKLFKRKEDITGLYNYFEKNGLLPNKYYDDTFNNNRIEFWSNCYHDYIWKCRTIHYKEDGIYKQKII